MANYTETIRLVIDADATSTKSALNKIKSDMKAAETGFGKFKTAASGAFSLLSSPTALLAGGAAVAAFGVKAVKAASDLNEQMSKTNAVFGDSAKVITDWARGAASDFGQSTRAALEAASSFGNMFLQLGVGSQQATDMSMKLTELASDFASFFNTKPQDAIDAITSAFRGEYDAVQKFVPTINAAAVQHKALEMGLADTTKALTEQDKALAAYELIMTGAGQAVGDFDRTSDGLANQQRTLGANFENLAATIGQVLIPAVTEFIQILNAIADPAAKAIDWIKKIDNAGNVRGGGIFEWLTGIDLGLGGAGDAAQEAGGKITKAFSDINAVTDVGDGVGRVTAGMAVNARNATIATEQYKNELRDWGTVAAQAGDAVDGALSKAAGAADRVANANRRAADEAAAAAQAARDQETAYSALLDQQLAMLDGSLGVAAAQRQFADAMQTATVTVDNQATASDEVSAAYDDATSAALQLAQKTADMAAETAKAGGTAFTAADKQRILIGTLQDLANKASGTTKVQLQGLIDKLKETGAQQPKPKVTLIDEATKKALAARDQVLALNHVHATSTVNVRSSGVGAVNAEINNAARDRYATVHINSVVGHVPYLHPDGRFYAQGGPVDAPKGLAVSAVVHGGEYVLSADVVDRIKRGVPSEGAIPTGGGGGQALVINFNGPVYGDRVAFGRMAKEAIAAAERTGVR